MFQDIDREKGTTDTLLVLLVDSIHGILDSYTFQVSRRDFQAQREVEVNLLEGRVGQVNLQQLWLLDRVGRGIDLPERGQGDQLSWSCLKRWGKRCVLTSR